MLNKLKILYKKTETWSRKHPLILCLIVLAVPFLGTVLWRGISYLHKNVPFYQKVEANAKDHPLVFALIGVIVVPLILIIIRWRLKKEHIFKESSNLFFGVLTLPTWLNIAVITLSYLINKLIKNTFPFSPLLISTLGTAILIYSVYLLKNIKKIPPKESEKGFFPEKLEALLMCKDGECRSNKKYIEGGTEFITMRRSCLPVIKDLDEQKLLPSLTYERVNPTDYSNAFTDVFKKLNFKENLEKTIEECQKNGTKLNYKELPSVFIVCAYSPLEIVEHVFRVMWAEGRKALMKNFTYANAEIAFSTGQWRNEKDNEIKKIEKCAQAIFKHVKAIKKEHKDTKEVIDGLIKKFPDYESQLKKYKGTFITRILLERPDAKIWGNELEIKEGENDEEISEAEKRKRKKIEAVRQALRFFRIYNGEIKCYIGNLERISHRIKEIKEHLKTKGVKKEMLSEYLPCTDFVIINKGGMRGTEVWDFYEGSHILLTHGKNCSSKHTTGYENFMEDWRQKYNNKEWDEQYGDSIKSGYLPLNLNTRQDPL